MDEVCYTKFIVKFMTFYYYLSLTTNNGDVNSSAIHYELAFLLDSVFRHWLLSIYFTGPRTRVLRGNKTSGQGASCWIPRQGARWHSVTAFSIIWFLLTNEQCIERERERDERERLRRKRERFSHSVLSFCTENIMLYFRRIYEFWDTF